jgi:hypothetical protein
VKRLALILLTAALIGAALSGCKTETTPVDNASSNARQVIVDAVAKLPLNYPAPKDNSNESPRQDGWFDVNSYFSVLNHLSIQSGYTLDYYYSSNGSAAYPVLYARKVDSAPFSFWQQIPPETDYLNYIQLDDTEESYFQYLSLSIQSGQFYLWWHAAYNDTQIVCNHTGIENIINSFSNGGNSMYAKFPKSVADSARQLDVTPKVTLNKDTAFVRVVVFTKWGGFKEMTYEFSRSFPHTIKSTTEKVLVGWNCGVTY